MKLSTCPLYSLCSVNASPSIARRTKKQAPAPPRPLNPLAPTNQNVSNNSRPPAAHDTNTKILANRPVAPPPAPPKRLFLSLLISPYLSLSLLISPYLSLLISPYLSLLSLSLSLSSLSLQSNVEVIRQF